MPAQSPTLSPTLSGDDRRIPRVVLRDPRLDLAHEIGTIGSLRIDSAAEPREHGDQRTAERETDQVVDRVVLADVEPARQDPVVAGDAEQAEPDDEENS